MLWRYTTAGYTAARLLRAACTWLRICYHAPFISHAAALPFCLYAADYRAACDTLTFCSLLVYVSAVPVLLPRARTPGGASGCHYPSIRDRLHAGYAANFCATSLHNITPFNIYGTRLARHRCAHNGISRLNGASGGTCHLASPLLSPAILRSHIPRSHAVDRSYCAAASPPAALATGFATGFSCHTALSRRRMPRGARCLPHAPLCLRQCRYAPVVLLPRCLLL